MADPNAPEASPAPTEAPVSTEQATLTANTDQNGTADAPADPDPLATGLSEVAGDEVEKLIPSMPPEGEAMLKAWLRTNIMWVQTEMEHARLGTPAADRAKLNP